MIQIEKTKAERVSEDLEKEVHNFALHYHGEIATEEDGIHLLDVNESKLLEIARHFADWQKEQDQKTIELAEDHAMLAGMEKMKEEMLKDAIPCKVFWHDMPLLDYTQEQQDEALERIGADVGDKVKLIIIKDET